MQYIVKLPKLAPNYVFASKLINEVEDNLKKRFGDNKVMEFVTGSFLVESDDPLLEGVLTINISGSVIKCSIAPYASLPFTKPDKSIELIPACKDARVIPRNANDFEAIEDMMSFLDEQCRSAAPGSDIPVRVEALERIVQRYWIDRRKDLAISKLSNQIIGECEK